MTNQENAGSCVNNKPFASILIWSKCAHIIGKIGKITGDQAKKWFWAFLKSPLKWGRISGAKARKFYRKIM